MAELNRTKKDTQVIWSLRWTFDRFKISKIDIEDHLWFTIRKHKKAFEQLKD